MFFNYVLIASTLIAAVAAQSSSTGKINSNGPSTDGAAGGQAGAGDPQVSNQGYQYNQGIQPYSYGYNTGIRPYSYSYTYPQVGFS